MLGFVLQKLNGNGFCLLKAGGSLIYKELKEGETLKVSPGNLVAFEHSVSYDIQRVPGIKNMIFGEGFFFATFTGTCNTIPLIR